MPFFAFFLERFMRRRFRLRGGWVLRKILGDVAVAEERFNDARWADF